MKIAFLLPCAIVALLISGCSGGSTPAPPSDFLVSMRLSFAASMQSRAFSRSLAVASPQGGTGVYIVTPGGSTRYTFTNSGNTYMPITLACASRNGWCIFSGADYSIFYNALTGAAHWYPKRLSPGIFAVVNQDTFTTGGGPARWDGAEFSYVHAQASGFDADGPGAGTGLSGRASEGSAPAILTDLGITLFSPLSPGQRAGVLLYGGDGNYYGTSRRGDPTVAVRWSPVGSPAEIPGVGIDIRDVNASGDILASPMLYRGQVKELLTIAGESSASPAYGLSVADDGAVLVGQLVVVGK